MTTLNTIRIVRQVGSSTVTYERELDDELAAQVQDAVLALLEGADTAAGAITPIYAGFVPRDPPQRVRVEPSPLVVLTPDPDSERAPE